VDYLVKSLFNPVLDCYTNTVEVKSDAEESFIEALDKVLSTTVFSAGCSNWYINKAGRNAAAWPGPAATFWRATWRPKWNDFVFSGGSKFWVLRRLRRALSAWPVVVAVIGVLGWKLRGTGFGVRALQYLAKLTRGIKLSV
jgi:hypothetical protein